jgi:sirohydrochlorin ferrochelatase
MKPDKRGLLLIAHGSRREASNDEVRRLTERLRGRLGRRFSLVSCAFLEIASPSIPEGIDGAVRRGVESLVLLPYFLAAGSHVAEDIPALVEAKSREHPGVAIEITPYLGAAEGLMDLLVSLAEDGGAKGRTP